jgi:hypothetical protein
MRPVLPSVFLKAGLPLPAGKSSSLLASTSAKLGPGSTAFGKLLHDLEAAEGADAAHPHVGAKGVPIDDEPPRKKPAHDDGLDPSARHAAQLAPPVLGGASPSAPASPAQIEARVRSSVEDLLPALVRRVAWSGDGRRGTVRLELGAGELAGGTLLVHVDDGRVRVRLSAPPGVDVGAWRERILGRLEARGLTVDSVESD